MSNLIDHIEITNFKSIRHLKIEGCKRINVFIGYPNVGKSVILEAMSALGYLQPDFREPFYKLCRLKESYELFYNANIRDGVDISINSKNEVSFRYLSESVIDFFAQRYNTDKQLIVSKNLFEIKNGEIHIMDKNIEKNSLKVKKYSFATSYNNFKTNGLTLAFPYGENLIDIIHADKELRKEVAELFKFYKLRLLIDPAKNTIGGFKELDEEFSFTVPFHQMADTLQRLIFHKAAIYSNENTVLLFEEPEAHMFPPYIKKFNADIIFKKDNGNQYFMSTHSPFVLQDLIDESRDELSIYIVGLKNGETTVKRLSEEELTEVYEYGVDLFFNMESYLD